MVYEGSGYPIKKKKVEATYGSVLDKYKTSKTTYQEPEDKQDFLQTTKVKEEPYKLDVTRRVREVVQVGAPRLEDEKIQPLKILSSKVIGTLFERVKFLEERINEIKQSIALRTQLHDKIVSEIESDITEKDSLVSMVSDLAEKRNLKLDISVLRKEKRHELVQFWKDVLELKTELRNLQEQYEVENKIASLFKKMG